MAKKKLFGVDLIHAVAVTLVLAVHSFLNSGYYSEPIQGTAMVLAPMVRMACMTCTPMFMMLTGYLCINRRWSLGYYRKLMPVLITYVLVGGIALAFRIIWQSEAMSLLGFFRRLLDFSAVPYAWYIEMYIGLFLLSPFLNAAWHGLHDKAKLALVITLLVMTAVPTVTNIRWQIFPDWWTGIYPLTYYFLGAWLREHPIRAKGWALIIGWLGLAVLAGGLVYLFRYGLVFNVTDWNARNGLFATGEAVCLFSVLIRCEGKKLPKPVRWCICRIGKLSLPLFMLSYITDQLLYPRLTEAIPEMTGRFVWMPVLVLIGLAVCAVMAQLIDWATQALTRLIPQKEKPAAP